VLELYSLKETASTQTYLIQQIKEKKLQAPVCVYATKQTQGIGSRGNNWIGIEGNLFMSFAVAISSLPKDLKLESASIYFASLLWEVLRENGVDVWLKWPNDFYVQDKKAGGMITTIIRENLICGVGLNIVSAPEGFTTINTNLSVEEIIKQFIKKLENFQSWKQVFRKYSVEFYKNKSFYTHKQNQERISLADAKLQEDGSIIVNNERIYSLR